MTARLLTLLSAVLVGVSCLPSADAPRIESLDPPAAAHSLAPRLAVVDGGGLLTWLEPIEGGGHRLRCARLDGVRWRQVETLHTGEDYFANWADCPAVVEAGDGSFVAHRLRRYPRDGTGIYDYGIQLFHRPDPESDWVAMGDLQDSSVPAEYGFVSYLAEGDGVRAFWLDGRAMVDGSEHGASSGGVAGNMQLRTASIVQGVASASRVLDDRVCECCQTDAALTESGPIVVYRDRSAEEIRDIMVVLRRDGSWSDPRPVHADGWRIAGCPVNGPAVAARGERVAVAWFTGADERPRVMLALSRHAGARFTAPVEVDGERPIGRVDVALDDDGVAWVSWIGSRGGSQEVLLRPVATDGSLGAVLSVAPTSAERAAGFPRLVWSGRRLLVTWVAGGNEGRRVRVAMVTMG